MLIGYVSDERYVTLPSVLLEFERAGQSLGITSRVLGAVYADLAPGQYKVRLATWLYNVNSPQIFISYQILILLPKTHTIAT